MEDITMLATELNLDSMKYEELVNFASKFIGNGPRPIKAARELFPTRPKGYVESTRGLRNYAWNKAAAIGCRLAGKIDSAILYEAICDRIYIALPDYAKGW
jgi:hypothetical protein